MNRIELDNSLRCRWCDFGVIQSEVCIVCDGVGSNGCNGCGGIGRMRICPRCGADQMIWALQSKFELPAGSGPWFWTRNADFTRDISKAMHFATHEQALRWLKVHRHLTTSLKIVNVIDEVVFEMKNRGQK